MNTAERMAIYERDGGLCGFCGQPVPWELLHIDHIQPKGLGGLTVTENLRAAHRRCNIAAGHDVIKARRLLYPVERVQTTPLSLRIPHSLLGQIAEIARREDRSLNAQVVRVFREWLAQQQKPKR